uniref:response regulator transcription factor n=1 Tax=Paractinoplanes polyasparticus TaxID=2856853 RepID=UPI001C86280A|nr:response regulator transcription factor [Actinoplanes polyasparticus]
MFRVAIVADQPIARAALQKLASDDAQMRVVSSVATVDDLYQQPNSYDAVVLDVPRFADASLEAVAKASAVGSPLITSVWGETPSPLTTIRAGARGCVFRHAERTEVRQSIRTIAQGAFYLSPQVVSRFETELACAGQKHEGLLAPREIETLRLIATGLTHGQIARRMGLTVETVNTYAKRIRAKLSVRNKAELTLMAIKLGHVPPSRASETSPHQ